MATVAITQPTEREIERNRGGILLLTAAQKLWFSLTACRDHNWTWSFTTKDMHKAYVANAPYDSHQTCPDCGATRLYNSKTMEGGPLFTKDLVQHG